MLAPRGVLLGRRLCRCFFCGLRCQFWRGFSVGLDLLLPRELLLDDRGDGVHVHFVGVRYVAEILRRVGLIVDGQENDCLHRNAAQFAFLCLGQKRSQQFRRSRVVLEPADAILASEDGIAPI